MAVEPLEQAIRSTRSILRAVSPDDLGLPTPCASWKVSDLVNHIVGGQFFFAAAVNGQSPGGDGPPDFAAGDFLGSFDQGCTAAVAAFEADGAMERTLTLPFGQMPGSVFVGIAATDTFVHGWDLAKATGQPTDLEPELATQLLATVGSFLPDEARGEDSSGAPFGPKQEAPEGASEADRLAAFLGRTP